VIFLGIILPFQVGPKAYEFYTNYRQSLEKLHQDIERYKKLGKKAEYWEQENQQAKLERDKIKAGLLLGDNRDLIGAKMQGLVRQLAQNTGILFKSLDPPDTSLSTGEWVLVIQSMQFDAKSKTLMNFLASLNIRSRRGKLTGTIKIIGFSRVPPLEKEE